MPKFVNEIAKIIATIILAGIIVYVAVESLGGNDDVDSFEYRCQYHDICD